MTNTRERGKGRKQGRNGKKEKWKAVRCNKVIVTLHDSLHIAELELIVSVEILDGRTILIPIL
jgi:hypothetical protein